jgi:thiamine-monophosphate kinase
MTTLRELGERKIVSEMISKYCHAQIGDDCADLERDNESIIVTMDPVPPPAAEIIGGDTDPYWKGRLLVTINASDLAAAAAEPLAFFVGVDALPDMEQKSFERFFQGVSDGCKEEGMIYAGGNIREGKQFSAIGTAIGTRDKNVKVRRTGADVGHGIAVVGNAGSFWLDALRVVAGDSSIDKNISALFTPKSQGQNMRLLAKNGFVSCAMDNSDGLLPSITQLAETNNCGALIDMKLMLPPQNFSKYVKKINISFQRLWLGWGDWNVVVGFQREKIEKITKFCKINGIKFCEIGEFTENREILLKYGEHIKKAPRIESERFAKDSWFSSGIQGYIDLLKNSDLPGGI